MNYTNEHYEEDKQIAEYIFRDHFRRHKHLKEDMIQNALLELWKGRQTFDRKSSYKTFANRICFCAMLRTFEKEQRHMDNNTSIFEEMFDNLQILDTLEAELDREFLDKIEEMKYLVLADQVKTVLSGWDKPRRKIIEMYLNRRSYDEIAKYNGVSKGYVHNQVKLFREAMEIWLGGRKAVA